MFGVKYIVTFGGLDLADGESYYGDDTTRTRGFGKKELCHDRSHHPNLSSLLLWLNTCVELGGTIINRKTECERNPMSIEAYNTIRQDYKQYTVNATQAGERVMTYAKWLEKYRGVCPLDIELLLKSV